MQPVELAQLVRQSLPLVESLAAQHGVELETGRADGVARADPTRLRQVLINLLSNAIKYNRPGGRVQVESRGARRRGDALGARHRPRPDARAARQPVRAVQPLRRRERRHRGHRHRPDDRQGAGRGHGRRGSTVESSPGRGTVFAVTLPAARDGRAAIAATRRQPTRCPTARRDAPVERAARSSTSRTTPVNVLLVEELVQAVGGLAIVSEATGAAGVERARRAAARPGPGRPAAARLRRLRGAAPAARRPAHRARSRASRCRPTRCREDIERGLAAGFADYWTKPIDFAVFIAALNRLFPARRPIAPSAPSTRPASERRR